MPYSITQSIVTFRPILEWWLDPATAAAEASDFPWLRSEASENEDLCVRCRCVDFEFFFTDPTLRPVRFLGRTWPSDTPRKLGTLSHVREGKLSGCIFCALVHDEICHLFRTDFIPEKLPLERLAQDEDVVENIAASKVWFQMYPRSRSALSSAPFSFGATESSLENRPLKTFAKVTLSALLDLEKLNPREVSHRHQYFNVSLLLRDGELAGQLGSVRLVGSGGETMDFDMVREWLDQCCNCHPNHDPSDCPTAIEGVMPSKHVTNFIDVRELCLVERGLEKTEYAALSYVWGTKPFFRHTSANRALLKKKGGVGRYMDRIPRTIKEAIIFCQMIDIPYLWADALCIAQDTSELGYQIANMNAVFSQATITIVAAAGEDAHAGLPGVMPNTRSKHQTTAPVGPGITITRTLSSHNISDQSLWNTRGWTFQEKILSQRMVIFSPDQVRMFCRHGSQTESTVVKIHDHPDRISCTRSRELSHSIQGYHGLDFEIYHNIVRAYTERSLTYDADVMNAFAGLMPLIAGRFTSSEFCYGLPVCLLDIALLWRPQGLLERRRTTGETFPSWSWVGWKGAVEYATARLLWERTRPNIRWMKGTKTAPDRNGGILFPDNRGDLDIWKRHQSKAEAGSYFTHDPEDSTRRHCRPGVLRPDYQDLKIGKLSLEADVAYLRLGAQLYSSLHASIQRSRKRWDLDRPVSTLKIISNRRRAHVGYVVVDGHTLKSLKAGHKYAFVCISRSTEEDGERDAAWDRALQTYSGVPGQAAINKSFVPRCKRGWSHVYDHSRYPCDICWSLYNVLMIDEKGERLGVGQIHVTAFDTTSRKQQTITLA